VKYDDDSDLNCCDYMVFNYDRRFRNDYRMNGKVGFLNMVISERNTSFFDSTDVDYDYFMNKYSYMTYVFDWKNGGIT